MPGLVVAVKKKAFNWSYTKDYTVFVEHFSTLHLGFRSLLDSNGTFGSGT